MWLCSKKEIAREAYIGAKYLLICPDGAFDARTSVGIYFLKDLVVKAFRTAKSSTEIEPVCHNLAHRVRDYVFDRMIAYRVEAALSCLLVEGVVVGKSGVYVERLLSELSEVISVEVTLGGQTKAWYLTVTDFIREVLRNLARKILLKEVVGGNSLR